MFGLFKKKEAPKKVSQDTQSARLKEFASGFLPKEMSILAVTGARELDWDKDGGEDQWKAAIGLTAWMEEDSPDIQQGEFVLFTVVDEQLLDVLRRRIHPDFIIKFKGRVSKDGQRLLLLDLPISGFDPDLKAILDKQKKPVTFDAEGLGTFTLNRKEDWFEAEVDWMGTTVFLVFDRKANRADCLANAKTLLAGAAEWDERIRECAVSKLLEHAISTNQAFRRGHEKAPEITRGTLMKRMVLDSIEIREDGSFGFWFNEGYLLLNRSIRVSGYLKDGPSKAEMEE